MAIEIDVQNDKFPYLARQICGDIATAFGYGIDHVYERDQEFIDFLGKFDIDNLEGEWLDKLGIVLGLPRPYSSTIPIEQSFQFDIPDRMLDGKLHGLSTTVPITIEGVTYDRNDGGLINSTYGNITEERKVSDDIYRKYLRATTLLKRVHSLTNIGKVLEVFVSSTRYAITFKNDAGFINDIMILLPATSADYKDALQVAFNNVFTTSPFVLIDVSIYFDDIYTVPEIERIIAGITGTDQGYTVVYTIEGKKAVFTITLDSSVSQYEDEIKVAVEAHFAGANDVIIVVQTE
jgi:hypothetical protein